MFMCTSMHMVDGRGPCTYSRACTRACLRRWQFFVSLISPQATKTLKALSSFPTDAEKERAPLHRRRRLNDDSCMVANDGDCDDGGAGSEFGVCTRCTDASDCGLRSSCPMGGSTDVGSGGSWDVGGGPLPPSNDNSDSTYDAPTEEPPEEDDFCEERYIYRQSDSSTGLPDCPPPMPPPLVWRVPPLTTTPLTTCADSLMVYLTLPYLTVPDLTVPGHQLTTCADSLMAAWT